MKKFFNFIFTAFARKELQKFIFAIVAFLGILSRDYVFLAAFCAYVIVLEVWNVNENLAAIRAEIVRQNEFLEESEEA